MKRKIIVPIFVATLLLSNGITAFAAPEVISVNGVNTVFDAEYYAAANPDVAAALGTGRDALVQHYIACGKAENRPAYAPSTDVNALLASTQRQSFTKKRILLSDYSGLDEFFAATQEKKIKSRSTFLYGKLVRHEEYDEQGNVLLETVSGSYSSATTYDEHGSILSEKMFYLLATLRPISIPMPTPISNIKSAAENHAA